MLNIAAFSSGLNKIKLLQQKFKFNEIFFSDISKSWISFLSSRARITRLSLHSRQSWIPWFARFTIVSIIVFARLSFWSRISRWSLWSSISFFSLISRGTLFTWSGAVAIHMVSRFSFITRGSYFTLFSWNAWFAILTIITIRSWGSWITRFSCWSFWPTITSWSFLVWTISIGVVASFAFFIIDIVSAGICCIGCPFLNVYIYICIKLNICVKVYVVI